MAPQTHARQRESAINGLAGRQHGVVSRQQLLAAGLKTGAIKRRLEAGRLWTVHRGVYAVGRPRLDRNGERMAAVLASGETAVLSHRSAAALWGFWRARGSDIDVTSAHSRCGRPGVRLHKCKLETKEFTIHNGIPITTPARTIFDLAEIVEWPRLNRACEEADRLHLLQMRDLERVVERGWGRHALKPIRPIIVEGRHADTTRSPLEQRFLDFCEEHAVPRPATNVKVLDREVDALWPEAKLIAELDSLGIPQPSRVFRGGPRPRRHLSCRGLPDDPRYRPTPSSRRVDRGR
jgi:hypothetical protein